MGRNIDQLVDNFPLVIMFVTISIVVISITLGMVFEAPGCQVQMMEQETTSNDK